MIRSHMIQSRYLLISDDIVSYDIVLGVGKKTAAVRQKYRNGTIDKIIKNNRGGKI
jgi:hypothetical protein